MLTNIIKKFLIIKVAIVILAATGVTAHVASASIIEEQVPALLAITGNVLEYLVLRTGPEKVLYVLKIEVFKGPDGTELKEGEKITAYSEEELSPDLVKEITKVVLEFCEGRYWIKNLLAIPPEGLSIDQILYTLVKSVNREDFAKKHDIELSNDKVRIIIELTSLSVDVEKLQENYDIVIEAQSRGRVRALAPIAELVNLARDPAVMFIRPPLKPEPAIEGAK